VPTGFNELAPPTNGLHPGQMIIVAARPGVGKSTFALDVCRAAAIHHDLATVPTLCDWTCLLNRTVMGFGPTKEVFTDEMVKQAYGLATT